MAITANTMISRAMRLIQVFGTDENPTAQEAADGLYALNSMLDAWSIERLMIYQVQQANYSWASGAGSKTIGNGGDFSASRPARIEKDGNFFRTSDDIDYPVAVHSREEYDGIQQKTAAGSVPEYLFHDEGFPLITLYAYPVPSQTLTLYLNTWKALQQFTSLTSSINLPPGYQAAIEYNLAIWIAPEHGKAAKAAANDIKAQAAILKTAIKSVNQPDLISRVEVPGTGRRSRILSDT